MNMKIFKITSQDWFTLLRIHINLRRILISVKRKLCSGLEKARGLSALFMLIFAHFEFDSAIYSIQKKEVFVTANKERH